MTEEITQDIQSLAVTEDTEKTTPPSSTEATTPPASIIDEDIESFRAIKLLNLLNPSNQLKLRDILEADYLSQHDLHSTQSIKIKLLTWNLNALPQANLNLFRQLLVNKDQSISDLFLINFQETISLKSLMHSEPVITKWCELVITCLSTLSKEPYEVVSHSGLLGLTTIVIAKESLAAEINEIEVASVGLGYFGWNNKGAISTKFRIGNISDEKQPGSEFQLINLHLVHGEDEETLKDRNSSLKRVHDATGVSVKSCALFGVPAADDVKSLYEVDLQENEMKKIGDQSLDIAEIFKLNQVKAATFVCGDMNYRLTKINQELALSYIENEEFKDLMSFDQLNISRNTQDIFVGFVEGGIAFKPTFKLSTVDVYDLKRTPSYTDRILFASDFPLKQTAYNSMKIPGSDHLPVFSEFEVETDYVNEETLKALKGHFANYYDWTIDKMQLIDITPAQISMDACLGIEENLNYKLSNLCEEELIYKFVNNNKGLFRRTDSRVTTPSGSLLPRETKTVSLEIKPTRLGENTRNYIVELDAFTITKSIEIKTNTKTIVGIALISLSEIQFESIVRSFEFLLRSKSKVNLTKDLSRIYLLESLNSAEKLIIKALTLTKPDFDLLAKLNDIGMDPNEGSVALINALYMWLRNVPGLEFLATERNKTVFGYVVKLIRFLGLDYMEGYEYFGFMFSDEYELLSYLEK